MLWGDFMKNIHDTSFQIYANLDTAHSHRDENKKKCRHRIVSVAIASPMWAARQHKMPHEWIMRHFSAGIKLGLQKPNPCAMFTAIQPRRIVT